MKAMNTIVKILTAVATIAGVVYIVATYGEQIVAWCKKMLASLPKCPCCQEAEVVEEAAEEAAEEPVAEEVPVEEPVAEEVPVEEPAAEEVPVVEVPAEESEDPVAEEADFAE